MVSITKNLNNNEIFFDNGYGWETPGKCSPDGHFKEYRYTHEIAAAVVTYGIEEITLKERVQRVKRPCDRQGSQNAVLVSIHIDTAGSDGNPDKEAGFFILDSSKCTAALVECGFMDNPSEPEFLQSPEGRKAMAGVIVEGVISYLNEP